MDSDEVTRKLTTIMAADVVGYSKMMSKDEEETLKTFRSYRKIINTLIEKHDGRVFNTAGDAILAEFGSTVECVRCTISIQEELHARNAKLPEDKRIHLRIGVNVGDVMIEGGDLFGDGVNVAARLEGLADPGGICISASAFEQVKNKLSIGFEDMGPQNVKNIPHPVLAFKVMSGPVSVTSVQDRGAPKPARAVRKGALATVAALVLLALAFAYWQMRPGTGSSLADFPADFSTQTMNAETIQALMQDMSIKGISIVTGKPFTITFKADGIADLTLAENDDGTGSLMHEAGRWWTENNSFCMQFTRFAQGQMRCPVIKREAGNLLAERKNGEGIPWTISKP